MKIVLESLHLKNFRSYVDETIQFDKNMNVIIGRNDIGKSTILEALEIFFNNEQVKIEPIDRNIYCSNEDCVEITCCFRLSKDAEIVVDSNVNVKLCDEYLLNSNNLLEIKKRWNCNNKTISVKDLKVFIMANYPKILSSPLINEKIADLKKILRQTVDSETYESVDKSKSSKIRQAIYHSLINENTKFETIEIDTSKDGTKDIWKSLQQYLPLYFLFKADRLNSDKDNEVQTPMKSATREVVSEMGASVNNIIDEVSKQLEIIGQKTLDKLSELDPEISEKLTPKISHKSLESIFSFELISDDGIPLSRRGSGIRRLILLSYFRVEAEKKVNESHNKSIIYAIEEPETAQHPDYQKMIMETFMDLSKNEMHQMILTTHTPEIAKIVDRNQLIFIVKGDDGNPHIETREEVKYKTIAETLGVLPYAFEKCVICVEGTNDVNFINNINKIPEFKEIIDLEKEHINIIPMSGSNLINWVTKNYLKRSNVKEFHIYDNDREDYRKVAQEIIFEKSKRRKAYVLKRREMENYIPPRIIENEQNIDLSKYYDSWDNINVPEILSDVMMKGIREYDERIKQIKTYLNNGIAQKITIESLKELGVFEEIENIFKEIKQFYEQ